ncbi:MAG: helix-turn-helix domain-containing protein [Thermoplasmata archaeon]
MRSATMLVHIPGNWIGDLCTSCDLSVKVLKCVPMNESGGMSLLQVDSPPDMTGTAIAERIRALEPQCNVELTPAGPGRFVGTAHTSTCAVCRLLSESGCFLDSATSQDNGLLQWNVVAPNAHALRSLVEKVRALGCSVELKKVSKLTTASELTRTQERVLQLAYELGYFEIPRKINLERLAKRLEVSKATLDVMIRRAQKKIIASHMRELA